MSRRIHQRRYWPAGALVMGLVLAGLVAAPVHAQVPDLDLEAVARRLEDLSAQAKSQNDMTRLDEYDDLWRSLSPEQREEVTRLMDEHYEAQARAREREAERFKRSLEDLRGDEWAAYTAAFFQATLFEADKPFEQALGENLQALGEQTGQTVPELVNRMNAQVRAEQAEAAAEAEAAQAEKLREMGRGVLQNYDQLAESVVIDNGFLGYATSTSVNRSALMVQQGMLGVDLQIRYQLNLLKNASGEVPADNFVNDPGYEVFNTVSEGLHDIGRLQAQGGDAATIEAGTARLTDYLALPGQPVTPEHLAARTEFINLLTPMATDVASKYALYQRLDNLLRIRTLDRNMLLPPRGRDEIPAFEARRDALDAEIADLKAQLAQLSPEQSEFNYLAALNQSPLLSAPIEVEGFEGPLWQYLGGEISGYMPTYDTSHRTPEKDQQALDQAIDYVDGLTLDVAFKYGTLVVSEDLVRFAGSPEAAGVRQNLTVQLTPMIPGTQAYMGELEGLFEREWTETEYERRLVDAGTGITAAVVGGVIVLFPPSAPVLVPVELTLMGSQLAIEGGRLVLAYQDVAAAQTLAGSGAGDFTALTRYEDVLRAQTFTFVITVAMTPLGVTGSLSSLDEAARLLQQAGKGTAAAGGTGRAAGEALAESGEFLDETRLFSSAVPETPPAVPAIDIDQFRNLTPEDQAAALAGLSDEAQGRIVSQLSIPDQKALGTAKVYQAIVRGIRENPEAIGVRSGNMLTELTAEQVAGMTDDEIRAAVRNGDFILNRDGKEALFADIGDDLVGPFSGVRGANEALGELGGDLPAPGYYAGTDLSQQQVDDLFSINVDALPVAERQAVILKRADALRQGFKPSFGMDPETARALVSSMIRNMQQKMGRALTLDELDRAGWDLGWGRPPEFGPPKGWADNVPAGGLDGDSGSTIIGGDTGSATVVTGEAAARPPLITIEQILGNKLFTADMAASAEYPLGWLPTAITPFPGRQAGRSTVLQMVDELTPPPGTGTVLRRAAGDTAEAARPALNSAEVMSEGGALIHLQPGNWTIPPEKWPFWRNYLYRSFMIGACQGDRDAACEDETPVGVLSVPAGKAKEVAASLSGDPQVAYVEADPGRLRQAVNDPLFTAVDEGRAVPDRQWALPRVGLTGAQPGWPPADGAGQVVVAVIDTGLAWGHPDFSLRNLWINAGEIPGNDLDDDGNGYVDDVAGWNFLDNRPVAWDFDGHGTLTASIIAADTGNGRGMAGINPRVRIMPLKAVNNAGASRAAFLAEAIVYAANNGARIINLSVGGAGLTRTEQLAIDYAWSRGVLVVAAAGNEAMALDDYGPAGAHHVLTVAATDGQDRRLDSSNFGLAVDLAAPGEQILGLRAPATDLMITAGVADYRPGANFVADGLYYQATGTSFAAPLVSGVASLLLSARPGLSNLQLVRMLTQSAVDVAEPGHDRLTGYGRLDAAAALAADPDFYVAAELQGVRVAQRDGAPVVEVIGTAAASEAGRAWLELGAGAAPGQWRRLPVAVAMGVTDGPLAAIPPQALAGQAEWLLRLRVQHADGREREARFVLRLQ